MSKPIEEYLEQLRKLLTRDLPAKEVENHLSEIRNHLNCASAEMSGSDTESRAIEEFGDVKSVAAKFISAHLPKRNWAVIGAVVSLAVTPIILLLGEAFLYKHGPKAIFGAMLTALVGFIAFSVLAQRLLSRQIAAIGVVTILGFPLVQCLLFVTIFPKVGHGLVPRNQAEAFVAEQQRRFEQITPIVSEIRTAERAYQEGSQPDLARLKVAAGYIVPTQIVYSWPAEGKVDGTLKTLTVPTIEQAKSVWSEHENLASEAINERQGSLNGMAVTKQFSEPLLSEYWVFLKDSKSLEIFGLYFLLMGLINYLCVQIPFWLRRVSRKIPIAT